MPHPTTPPIVTKWLFACCGMIFVMALLGAITRLTESGLSMTSWEPLIGAIPPLNDAQWHKVFADYQAIPQYQILNRGMTLDAFKGIFFWEWLHRLWGRLIGLAFAVPLAVFIAKKYINRALALRLAVVLMLGGMEGFVGWFMVQSGLSVRTSVSPYRLALHLAFALTIYSILLWTALRGRAAETVGVPQARRHGWVALGFLVVTIIWGAFTAGLHAGEAYNTWPLMEGQILPDAAWTINPPWLNMFENLALVQFTHRWLGPMTMCVILSWVARQWRGVSDESRKWLAALGAMAVIQPALGLTTLVTHAEIAVAATHQAGAIALLTLLLVNLRRAVTTPNK